MKKIKYLLLLTGLFLATGCLENDASQAAGKDVHFIFLFDHVNKKMVQDFDNLLHKQADSLNDALTQELPAGVASISFDVYSTASESAIPLVLTLDQGDDKMTLEKKAKEFLKQLARDTVRTPGTRSSYVLKTLKGILTDIDDSSAVYRVLLFSGLYENSGPPNTEKGLREAAKQGTFHFVTSDNVVIAAAVDTARSQLDSSSSWIYRNLIEKARAKPWLASVPIQLYATQEGEPKAGEDGVDSRSIEEFWDKLFDEMRLRVQRKGHLDLSSYHFFRARG